MELLHPIRAVRLRRCQARRTTQINNQTLSNGEQIVGCDAVTSENTIIAGTQEVRFTAAGDIILGTGFAVTGTADWVGEIDGALKLDRQDLDYMHARYASPWLGRFTSTDPVDSSLTTRPQSWNKYSYAYNNPILFLDPDGQTGLKCDACGYASPNDALAALGPLVAQETPEQKALARKLVLPAITLGSLASPVDEVGIGMAVAGRAVTALRGTRVAGAVTKLGNIFFGSSGKAANLSRETVIGAGLEAAGEVVKRKASGRAFDHLTKFQEARRGAARQIDQLKSSLADPTLSPAEREAIEATISEFSQRLDAAESLFRRVRDNAEKFLRDLE